MKIWNFQETKTYSAIPNKRESTTIYFGIFFQIFLLNKKYFFML